jgi:hypothetical protein
MSFLPEGTEIPTAEGRYMKFSELENRFRVLDSAITGYELWVGGKPLRRKTKNEFTADELAKADIDKFKGTKRLPQYFWAFPVFNYQTEQVEILEVKQVSVMRGIDDYLKDDDYGADPKEYDIIVIKDDSKDKIEYRVKAKPPKPMSEEIKKAYKDTFVKPEKLFEGGDPFSNEEGFDINDEQVETAKKEFATSN